LPEPAESTLTGWLFLPAGAAASVFLAAVTLLAIVVSAPLPLYRRTPPMGAGRQFGLNCLKAASLGPSAERMINAG
jgi:hypothetical protein